MWENGTHDAQTLHELTSIPLSTVYKYIKKLKKNTILDPLPRPGRPKKLSPKKRRYLGQLISINKFSTCTELANILNVKYTNLDITDRTVLNELHDLNYICKVLKSIPLLTEKHKQKRIEFATKYKNQN